MRFVPPSAESRGGPLGRISRCDFIRAETHQTGFQSDHARRATVPLLAPLTAAARRTKKLACLHPFTTYPAPVSPDLAAFKNVAERVPGVSIADLTDLLPSYRAIKSPAELRLMKQAIAATAAGYSAAMKAIRPGSSEGHVARVLEQTYIDHGATGLAYNSIVGSASTAPSFITWTTPMSLAAGSTTCSSSTAGAMTGRGYAADVTRTWDPGFRRKIFRRSARRLTRSSSSSPQLAAIRASHPGAKMSDVDAAARETIEKAGLGDYFIHGIGHQLGMEVHDVTPDGPLEAGNGHHD